MIYYEFIINFILIFFISIIVHELAHGITYSRITGKKAEYDFKLYPFKVELKSVDNFQSLTTEQYRTVLYFGVLVGLMTLLFLSEWLIQLRMEMLILMTLLYSYGCRNDIKEIIKTYKCPQ